MFETFAGIGAQHKAITNINRKYKTNFKIIGTSEWDARSIISYAQIHNKLKYKKELKKISKWSMEKVDLYLNKYIFSLNSKSAAKRITSKNWEFKCSLIASNVANNNFPDIKNLKGENISNIDVLTYSFPCQGLSIANMGRDKGISEKEESSSNLIWQIRRILLEARKLNLKLPKYLLMENVNNLIGPKHIKDYLIWKKELKKMGYTTYTAKLDGIDFGSIQQRKRLFAISTLNLDLKLNDIQFKNILLSKYLHKKTLSQRKKKYWKIFSSSRDHRELLEATPNDSPSRQMMLKNNRSLDEPTDYILKTLTTKQDRHPNLGMLSVPHRVGKLAKRFITTREAYLIMGFTNADYNKIWSLSRQNILTKESLYRQAGNSIVVEVLEGIFKYIHDTEGGKYE